MLPMEFRIGFSSMAKRKSLSDIALRFAIGAAVLLAAGIPHFKIYWPCANRTDGWGFMLFMLGVNCGGALFEAGVVMALCAMGYFLFRRGLNRTLGLMHFYASVLSVLLYYALKWWTRPEPLSGKFDSHEITAAWFAVVAFVLVQILLVVNASWSAAQIIARKRTVQPVGPHHAPNPPQVS